jgi:hypothetical protein
MGQVATDMGLQVTTDMGLAGLRSTGQVTTDTDRAGWCSMGQGLTEAGVQESKAGSGLFLASMFSPVTSDKYDMLGWKAGADARSTFGDELTLDDGDEEREAAAGLSKTSSMTGSQANFTSAVPSDS